MTDTICSPVLKKLGREMVSRCGGLPLGVAILGGLLVPKKFEDMVSRWEVVHRDVNAYMNEDEICGVEGILSLSYNDLPYHLKPCFLYLGLFPEDFEIPTRKLIHLWIAEGFVPEQKGGKGPTMEDVAEHQYLDELVQRSLVQVDKRGLTGGVKTFRMHDLMRDVCLSKARETNFLDISQYDQQHGQTSNSSTDYRIRRHAIHCKGDKTRFDYLENSSNYSHLRTFLVFDFNGFRSTHYPPKIKLLRVLDLESVRITNKNITQEVGKLIHLRYLALRSGGGRLSISPSIGNLRNLRTLRLFGFSGLPESETTSRMSQLRHLHLGWDLCQINDKWRVDNLINLQTFKGARARRWLRKGSLEKLTNLRSLGIVRLLRSQIEEIILPAVVAKSSSSLSNDLMPLTSLLLHCDYPKEEFPNLEPLSHCDKLLKLQLSGKCKSENLHYPPNLTKLFLFWTCLNQDPMTALQHLPNLKHLRMMYSYDGEEMICSAEGFPQLQYLTIRESKLKEWRIEKGGMPLLKCLEIWNCEELAMLPEGLRFITTLQQLTINGMMSPEFKARVERGSGEDWYKIQHIPSIII